MSNKILITEEQFKYLIEERGVFKNHKYLIKSIVKYIDDYVKSNQYTKIKEVVDNKNRYKIQYYTYVIDIPERLTNLISWAEKVSIKVLIYNVSRKDADYIGGDKILNKSVKGSYTSTGGEKLTDSNKLEDINIRIVGYAVDRQTYNDKLYTTIFHEITHAYENYNRLLKHVTGMFDNNQENSYDSFSDYENEEDQNIGMFKYFNLYVLNKSESNAIVSETYADLERLRSKRENFSNDIKETESYKEYYSFKYDMLPKLEKLDNNYWEEFKKITFLTNKTNQSTSRFKTDFINTANHKLDEMFKSIGKVASLYYDDLDTKNKRFGKK